MRPRPAFTSRALTLALALVAACSGGDRSGSDTARPGEGSPGGVGPSTSESAAAGSPAADSLAARHVGCLEGPLTADGIGAFRIGLPADSIPGRCRVIRDALDAADEGSTVRRVTVAGGADTATATIDRNLVWRIEVADAGLRTTDSLGVGSTLDDLLRRRGARGIGGDGRFHVVVPTHCGLSFQLRLSGVAPESVTMEALRRMPPTTPVSRVLVTGCTEGAGRR